MEENGDVRQSGRGRQQAQMPQLFEESAVNDDPTSLRRRFDDLTKENIHDHNKRLASLQEAVHDVSVRLIRIEERMNHADTVLVERVAKAAVAEVFRNSGVNVEDPNQLDEFRENLRFNTTLRSAIKRAAWGAGGTLVSVIMMLLWLIIRDKIGDTP